MFGGYKFVNKDRIASNKRRQAAIEKEKANHSSRHINF
jgi:hypothetical protein